jgi:hypothetical protein
MNAEAACNQKVWRAAGGGLLVGGSGGLLPWSTGRPWRAPGGGGSPFRLPPRGRHPAASAHARRLRDDGISFPRHKRDGGDQWRGRLSPNGLAPLTEVCIERSGCSGHPSRYEGTSQRTQPDPRPIVCPLVGLNRNGGSGRRLGKGDYRVLRPGPTSRLRPMGASLCRQSIVMRQRRAALSSPLGCSRLGA